MDLDLRTEGAAGAQGPSAGTCRLPPLSPSAGRATMGPSRAVVLIYFATMVYVVRALPPPQVVLFMQSGVKTPWGLPQASQARSLMLMYLWVLFVIEVKENMEQDMELDLWVQDILKTGLLGVVLRWCFRLPVGSGHMLRPRAA